MFSMVSQIRFVGKVDKQGVFGYIELITTRTDGPRGSYTYGL